MMSFWVWLGFEVSWFVVVWVCWALLFPWLWILLGARLWFCGLCRGYVGIGVVFGFVVLRLVLFYGGALVYLRWIS